MRVDAMLVAGVLALGAGGCAASPEPGSKKAAEGDVAATMEVKVRDGATQFLLHVTNTGDRALEFTFPSSQRYDFMVHGAGGESVWTWSANKSFLQAISEVTLAPGETWDFEAEWESGNRTGRYQVVGVVTARDREIRQSATFDLP